MLYASVPLKKINKIKRRLSEYLKKIPYKFVTL